MDATIVYYSINGHNGKKIGYQPLCVVGRLGMTGLTIENRCLFVDWSRAIAQNLRGLHL